MINLLLIICYIFESRGIYSHDVEFNNNKLDLGFSWSTCGTSNQPIQLQELSVLPDPVIIPGTVFMETSFSINKTQISPLPLSINVKKKVFFVWVKIPCEESIGSCSYDDFCKLITRFTCPQAFKQYGIPCNCPLTNGKYNLPNSGVIDIDKSILPSWLESGDYKVSASLSDKNGNEVFCIDVSLAVGTKFKSFHIVDNCV